MQRDQIDIIQRLCVIAGTIMEDAGLGAILRISEEPVERTAHLERLAQDGSDIAILLAAAAALDRRIRQAD